MAKKLDTLKCAKRLIAAGVPQKQAEAQAELFVEVIDENLNTSATKEDIDFLKGDINILKEDVNILKGDVNILKEDVNILKGDVNALKGDINILSSEIDVKNAELKIDLIKWMFSLMFTISGAQAAVIIGLLKFAH